MTIDVHWHHVPAAFVEQVLSGRCPIAGSIESNPSGPTLVLEGGFRQDLPPALVDPDLAVASMDAAGIDAAAISVAPPLTHHSADAAVARIVSEELNNAFAALAETYPGRFLPLANVPLQDPARAAAELRRSVVELRIFGVAIGTNVNGRNLGDAEFRPFWRAVADHDAFVFIHPSPQVVFGKDDRLGKHNLVNFVGLPIDTAAAVASLIFDGVYEEFGPLKTCFAHGGGAFPYIASRWEHGYRARGAAEDSSLRNPNSYFGSIYCDSLTHSPAALRFLIELLGADHVVLGSDYPFDMGESRPIQAMHAAVNGRIARAKIAGGTAARLLGVTNPRAATKDTAL